MAIFSELDGNLNGKAKTGDTIVGSTGSYEVLDSSRYAHMTDDQLNALGVSKNNVNGYYTKKVSNITTNDLVFQNYNTANAWKAQADQ